MDLTEQQASQAIKITGADSTGVETNYVNATSVGRLMVDAATTSVSHVNRIDVASTTQTASSSVSSIDSNGFGMISYVISITAVSGTTPGLQLSLDVSEDATNWFEIIKSVKFTITGNNRFQRASLSAKYYRFRWTITGISPSFTFSITSTLKPYSDKRNVVISNYSDLDLTNTNNISSIFQAADSNNISVMTIRGADGGNNGQFQVQASNDGINWASITSNITQAPSTTILTTFSNQSFRYYQLIVTVKTSAGTRVLDVHWGAS